MGRVDSIIPTLGRLLTNNIVWWGGDKKKAGL